MEVIWRCGHRNGKEVPACVPTDNNSEPEQTEKTGNGLSEISLGNSHWSRRHFVVATRMISMVLHIWKSFIRPAGLKPRPHHRKSRKLRRAAQTTSTDISTEREGQAGKGGGCYRDKLLCRKLCWLTRLCGRACNLYSLVCPHSPHPNLTPV